MTQEAFHIIATFALGMFLGWIAFEFPKRSRYNKVQHVNFALAFFTLWVCFTWSYPTCETFPSSELPAGD